MKAMLVDEKQITNSERFIRFRRFGRSIEPKRGPTKAATRGGLAWVIGTLAVRRAVPCGAEPAIDVTGGEIATSFGLGPTVASDATDLAAFWRSSFTAAVPLNSRVIRAVLWCAFEAFPTISLTEH